MAPGQIGAMTVRNRVVMSPMETMYGTPDGLPSERTRDYFAARARGGVGLITLGATGIDNQHPETPGGLHLATDEAVDAHRALVEVVHEHGAKIQPQIVHAGPDGLGPEIFGVTSLGPSVIPSYLTGRPSVEISKQQLCGVLDLFRAAARRAVEAGYDGIELHAAHGYMLLGSFLAPQRNRRTDDYRGDSARGRSRVVLDALAAIRSEIGDALPITLRISGYERVAGGRPIFETAQLAPEFVAAGVDAFHVSGGVIDRLVTGMVNGADDGDELNIGAAAAVKQVVDVPVIAVGRIHDPVRAERILADGRADFIAMGRPLLADPDLPRKLRDGQAHRIRRCISCENCIDAMEQRFSVDCAVNPRTGKERETVPGARRARQARGGDRRRAGRAEAARVAAERGHRVTLFERSAALGGALRWASVLHPENQPFLRYLRDEIRLSSAEIHLDQAISVQHVLDAAPDAVVVATGGHVAVPAIPGTDLPHVHTGPGLRELLGGQAESGAPAWQRLGAPRLAAGGSGWCGPPRYGWPAAPGCPSGAESPSSAATWSLWSWPNSWRAAAGWCRSSNPPKTSPPKWATNARLNTWIASTGWASRCTSGQPWNGSPPRRWCSPLPVAPPGSCRLTASCSPARSNPTPLCSTRWSPPCRRPTCTPPATAPGWA